MRPFEYVEPKTVAEATRFLSECGETARILAGGVDLVPRLRKDEFKADFVVNIQRIPDIAYIEAEGKKDLRFGALASLHAIETSAAIRKQYPIFYQAVHQITSVQAKYMGTAVGNLCVATPASDVATVLFALGASLGISGPAKERTVPIEAFYTGYRSTCLQRGEWVVGVTVPRPEPGTCTAFMNLARTHGDVSKVTVAVSIQAKDGLCREARIAIGSAAPTVFRAIKAEASLAGKKLTAQAIEEAAEAAAGETRPITDLRSSAEYRKDMARVLVRRAIEKALEQAKA
ncbi:MAG: xanthine dehydrogenase family protein subunit M [Thermodesulfobacteriota bacterium]